MSFAPNWSIKRFDNLESTQDYLQNLLNDNPDLSEGLVINATSQSDGRGRHGRSWQGANGNLYLSFLIRPKCDIGKIGQISLLSSLAIYRAITSIIDEDVILKWPNDILIGGKKCCGILLNHENDCLIIGVGVNIKSAPLDISTFLQKYSNTEITAQDFMDRLLSLFSDYYKSWQNEGFTNLRDEWLNNTYEKGRKISVKIGDNKITGAFQTIDMLGNLILICDKSGEEKKVTSGEILLL